MLDFLHRWLTSRFSGELARIQARLVSLESEKLARELETSDLVDALTKHLQRLRQRDRRVRESATNQNHQDALSPQLELDPISRLILESRRGVHQLPRDEPEE